MKEILLLKRMKKSEGQTTLIALVVTIVILLILAGVSISLILDNNGIIQKAREARNKYGEARANEQADLNEISDWINKQTNSKTEDTSKIKVNFNGYEVGTWTNKDINISLSNGNLQGETYQYKIDQNEWTNCGSGLTINTDKNNTYYFRIVDSSGNVKDETQGYDIKRDTTGPDFDLTTTRDIGSIGWSIVSITDAGIGVEDSPKITVMYRNTSNTDEEFTTSYEGTTQNGTIGSLSMKKMYEIKVTIKDKMGNVTETIKKVETLCFVAGTKVLTENGLRNIEDIKIGDKVYAINMDNNAKELKRVTSLFEGCSDAIYEITVGNDVIKATPRHQFYIVDKGWIRAYDLAVGDQLVAKDNENMKIEKIEKKEYTQNPIPVYNLTVEGHHNYLITEYELLVHNAESPV